MTLFLRGYGALTWAALPAVARVETKALVQTGFGDRASEKQGHPSADRPDGRLLWVHSSQINENLPALALIDRLAPRAHVLLTTGTPSSARLAARRLPMGATHQFAALDAPRPVARFLDHWRPDAALFVESDLWPNTLRSLARRNVPAVLVNARLSERALNTWRKRPRSARVLLQAFRLILAQNEPLAVALRCLGATDVRVADSLGSLVAPPAMDQAIVAAVPPKSWVAASTHHDEEERILNAHAMVLEQHPAATLILAPDDMERADAVSDKIAKRGWPVARRSAGDQPHGPVWLADRQGELGSFFSAAPIVFLGGSLVEKEGGQNPFEAAHRAAALMAGPHVFKFADAYSAFAKRKAVQTVSNVQTLATTVANMMTHPPLLYARREASKDIATKQKESLDQIETALVQALVL